MSCEELVWQCLERAVARFNEGRDAKTLLCPRCENPKSKSEAAAASERAITHRLAVNIDLELILARKKFDSCSLAVDCEYNRHIGAAKSLAAEAEERIWKIVKKARKRDLVADEDGFYVFSIAPDIIVHQRGNDVSNLLVVEVKKRSNPEPEEYDRLKLELFTTPKVDDRGYGYKLGAWIVAEDVCPQDKRRLQIFKQFKDGIGKVLPT